MKLSLDGQVSELTTDQVLEALTLDSNYYGDFGKQFLSNSDIRTLLSNPEKFGDNVIKSVPMVIGGYFHTIILEPEKVDSFKILDATTRNTKKYKELSDGEICLLESEADKIGKMRDKLLGNDIIRGLIRDGNVEYEVPAVTEIFGQMWKGKADVLNHDEKLIIDLKTTGDIEKFRSSAYRYNYDSQAYIYQQLFPGYDMIFVAVDKNSHKLRIYECSDKFLQSGQTKAVDAIAAYRLITSAEYDPAQYLETETL